MCFTPYLKPVKGYMQLLPDGNCLQCDRKKTEEIVSRLKVELEDPKYILSDEMRSSLYPCVYNSSINHIKLFCNYIACFITLTLDEENVTDVAHGVLTHHGKSYKVRNRKKKYYNFHPEVNSVLWANQSLFFPDGITEKSKDNFEKVHNVPFQYWSYVLQRPQLKNFEDDVRKYVFEHPEENGKTYLCPDPHGIKFVACGEYGSKHGRPHYHIIFLGFMPLDIVKSKNHNSDSPSSSNFKSYIIDKIWDNKGIADVAYDVNDKTLRYCCKYLSKTLTVEKIIPKVTVIAKEFADYDISSLIDERYANPDYTPFIHYSNNLGMSTLNSKFASVLSEFDLTPVDLKKPEYIAENNYFLIGVNKKRKTYFIYKENFLRLPHDLRRHFVDKISYHSFSGFYDKALALSLDERLEVITKSCILAQNVSSPCAINSLTPFENSFSYDCCVSTWSSSMTNYTLCYQDKYNIDFKKLYHDQKFLKTICSPYNEYMRLQVEKCIYLGNDDYTKSLLEEYKELNLGAEPKKCIVEGVINNILNYSHICSKGAERQLPCNSEYKDIVHSGFSAVRGFVDKNYNRIIYGNSPDKKINNRELMSERVDHVTYCDGTKHSFYSNELELNSRQLQLYSDILFDYKPTKYKMLMPNPDTGLLGGFQRSSTKISSFSGDDGFKFSGSKMYNKSLPFYKIENMCLYDWLRLKGSTVLDDDGRLNTDKPMSQYVTSKRKRFYKVMPHEGYFKMHWDNIEKTFTDYLINLEKPNFDDVYTKVTPDDCSSYWLKYCSEANKKVSMSNLIKIKTLLLKALFVGASKELTVLEDFSKGSVNEEFYLKFIQDIRDIISDYNLLENIEKLRLYVFRNIGRLGAVSKPIIILNRIISRLNVVKTMKISDFKGGRFRPNPFLQFDEGKICGDQSNLKSFDDVFKFLMFYNPSFYRSYFAGLRLDPKKKVPKWRIDTPLKRFEFYFGITMDEIQEIYGHECLDKCSNILGHGTLGDKIKSIINKSKSDKVIVEVEANDQIKLFDMLA